MTLHGLDIHAHVGRSILRQRGAREVPLRTDFPLFNPDRWLAEFDQLDLKDEVRKQVMFGNACGLVGIDPAAFALATRPGL